MQYSPFNPLKGRIAANISQSMFTANTPFRACPYTSGGQGVNKIFIITH
jgi:hypothetical protein